MGQLLTVRLVLLTGDMMCKPPDKVTFDHNGNDNVVLHCYEKLCLFVAYKAKYKV